MSNDNNNPYVSPTSLDNKTIKVQQKIPNKRVFAFLFDNILITIFTTLISALSLTYLDNEASLLSLGISFIYLLLKDTVYNGQSIGKRIVGIQIISSTENNFLSNRDLMLRNALLIIPIVPLIEYFVMRFSNLERRLGDRLADTRVIDLRPDRSDSLFLVLSLLMLTGFIIFYVAVLTQLNLI